MAYLIDTNILVRLSDPNDTNHALALRVILDLHRKQEMLFIARQSIYEYWTVATRPATQRGGLGMSPAKVRTEVDRYIKIFTLLTEPETLYQTWLDSVTTMGITGALSHDARLAAVVSVFGIDNVLTFNTRDFVQFGHLTAVDPAMIDPASVRP